MRILTRRSMTVACAVVLLALLPGDIFAQPAPASSDDLHVEAVRAALGQFGYVVDTPMRTSHGHVVVEARAASGAETVRAFVFADASAAAAAHRQAQALGDGLTYSDDVGPQLQSGYGASAWRRNVALIQSTPETFAVLMPSEIDCLSGVSPGVPFREYPVNPAAIQAIQSFQ
jgi:hypothetical protein